MKKLLLLGGSSQQIIAIDTAKKLGYYTVLCDFLSDNPGQYHCDKFYLISTTDKEAILEVAKKENIDGIVAYSSDPAAPTAAYVAEKMNLPGIPFSTAESFCNKHLFRKFLTENGFNVPMSVEMNNQSISSVLDGFTFPVIIKPTDSSGSKGVTVIRNGEEFNDARDSAATISRNGVLLAEEFIERDHPDVIEAEIFVVNGKVTVWGLMNSVRDNFTNPLLPAAYGYPLNISTERVDLVKKEVSRLVKCSKVVNGAFNIEMVITKSEKLYFLDAGPRNGGNELPEYISEICGANLVEATIYSAMGEFDKLKDLKFDGLSNGYWGMSVLHSSKPGTFNKIEYDEYAHKFLFRESFFKEKGDYVGAFEISRDAIGLAFFKFSDKQSRDEVLNDFVGSHTKILVD